MKDDQKEFLKNNVENAELADFTKEVKKEKKVAEDFDFDKIIANKTEESLYKAIQAFEQKPVKSIILTVLGVFILKKLVTYFKK
jgi:hypothetical protein